MSILFKNLILYRFTQPFELTAEQLDERLQEKLFRPCAQLAMTSYGWLKPLGKEGKTLVHESAGCLLIAAKREEKILPASVITEEVREVVEGIEQRECREVFSKERKALREDVTMQLLPKAFSKYKTTQAYIDRNEGWLIVDASSYVEAEMLTSCLRECLGSLPIINPPVKNIPSVSMTQWLQSEELPGNFSFGQTLELKEPGDEGGTVAVRNEDLLAEGIGFYLEEGKQVSRLGVEWNATLTCRIGSDLRISQLRFTDVFQEQRDDIETETALEQMDADFTLMSGTLKRFIKALVEAFGGEA